MAIGDVFLKSGGVYSQVLNIVGATGAAGPAGSGSGSSGLTKVPVVFVSNDSYTVATNSDGSQTITPSGSGASAGCPTSTTPFALAPGSLFRFSAWVESPTNTNNFGGIGIATSDGLACTIAIRDDANGTAAINSYSGSDIFNSRQAGGTNDIGYSGDSAPLHYNEIAVYVISDSLVSVLGRTGSIALDVNKDSFSYGTKDIVPMFFAQNSNGGPPSDSYTFWGAAYTLETGYDVSPF